MHFRGVSSVKTGMTYNSRTLSCSVIASDGSVAGDYRDFVLYEYIIRTISSR